MSLPTNPIQGIQPLNPSQAQSSQAAQNQVIIAAEAIADSLQTFTDQFAVNTLQLIRRNSETLEERVKRRVKPEQSEKQADAEEAIMEVEAADEVAGYYENKYPDMKAKSLLGLKDQLGRGDSAEEILQKVLEYFPDPVQADEAIEYLLRVLPDEFKEKILESKGLLHKRFNRQIRAGRNIFQESVKFAEEGLGSATELRDMYTELTGNPKDPLDLFEELLAKFPFEKMRQAISFWLHALGADLNKKGSSIEKGELHRLVSDARSLQAILGVYRFFATKQRELLLNLLRRGQEATPQMHYQHLAKLFVRILLDKYPSPEKILFLKYDLKIDQSLQAQEAVLSIMCSALRGVAPKLFRSQKHREDLLACFLKALEAIEEILEEDNKK